MTGAEATLSFIRFSNCGYIIFKIVIFNLALVPVQSYWINEGQFKAQNDHVYNS